MKEKTVELKLRLQSNGLYYLLLKDLYSCKKHNKDLISFKDIWKKVCTRYSIDKKTAWEILFFLQSMNLIIIIVNHGILLNYKIENDEIGLSNLC